MRIVRTYYYFAYGSNLHPLRLGRRTPSCRLLGVASLTGYRLRFHKRSDADGSAKCNVLPSEEHRDAVMGAVYELDMKDQAVLDRIEGLGPGGYERRTARVKLGGQHLSVFFYAALETHIDARLIPFTWYRDLVWCGALWHGFPAAYVEGIRRIKAFIDPDSARAAEHRALCEAMRAWRPEHGYAES